DAPIGAGPCQAACVGEQHGRCAPGPAGSLAAGTMQPSGPALPRDHRRSPPSETPEWKPPPEVELIQELNGHAGRLATLLGLIVAALALSMSDGAIKDALIRQTLTLSRALLS